MTDFVTRTALFENRIAEYMDVFEKRKRRNVRFAVQKIISDDTPQELGINPCVIRGPW